MNQSGLEKSIVILKLMKISDCFKVWLFWLGIITLCSCEDPTAQPNFLEKTVLNISQLPPNTTLIEENTPLSYNYKAKEFYLETSPEDLELIFSGRKYKKCNTQEVLLHDAFPGFNHLQNVLLEYCIKTKSIVIYNESTRLKIFILFEHS